MLLNAEARQRLESWFSIICLLYLFSPFNVQLDRLWPPDACALLPAVSAHDEACAATVMVPAMENVL